ncbi:SagB family peptide dehydrogenase [Priestia taiwanensis]|uniref:NADH oxidase n=1 Tax=Priestia taiwanensis TaxID=1347902 RepID=A0A917ANQ0_9BACI|nr:SagB family peptide dehydrogenase [Priestia taiwanensis]MBM7362433.1 SagB-type dehydrogenase family enzyme [Priestia taiwanensis]GGE62204.1 NADH oxidase [Priestia taiwanensis]
MHLDTFLYQLHFDTEKAMSSGHSVNWDDKPLPYKLYRNVSSIPLCTEVPFNIDCLDDTRPTLRTISHLLWYTFGLTQFSEQNFLEYTAEPLYSYRRFVPSGGALYPNEVYIYLKMDDVSHGVYHYDVAHHRLILIREGNIDSYLNQALGNRCEIEKACCTVFVSTMFWKNFFKYKNFSYRLQGLDAGALIGQLLEVTKRYRYETTVYFQFLDEAVNHLLGLSTNEESVYAVIPLSVDSTMEWCKKADDKITATELCQELPRITHNYYIRSRHIETYPFVQKANEACMLEQFSPIQQMKQQNKEIRTSNNIPLPNVTRMTYDFVSSCRKRYSPEMDFILKKMNVYEIASLFHEAMTSYKYRNDIDDLIESPSPRISIYSSFYLVEGVLNGAYYYDVKKHVLQGIRHGDQRSVLQSAMTLDNVNLQQTPVCIHLVGDREYMKHSLGYRGYRIQQMEAGMLLQRLLLAGGGLNIGGHPLLGYNSVQCDQLYEIDKLNETTLIQLPMGAHYQRSWLKAGLHH